MKINVERGAFLKALSHVQSVVERRNTIPILSNVMLEAAKGGSEERRVGKECSEPCRYRMAASP